MRRISRAVRLAGGCVGARASAQATASGATRLARGRGARIRGGAAVCSCARSHFGRYASRNGTFGEKNGFYDQGERDRA